LLNSTIAVTVSLNLFQDCSVVISNRFNQRIIEKVKTDSTENGRC